MSNFDPPEPTHCPSCGTELTDSGTNECRCEQCDRDLTLPEDAIKDQLCLFCKIPEADSDEAVEYIELETGERICSACLADCRSFKFERSEMVFFAEWLTDQHKQAIQRAMFEISEEFGSNYTHTESNAARGRIELAPDDTIEMTLDDLDEEQRQELRDALEDDGDDGDE